MRKAKLVPILAFLLSLPAPGLGHLCLGRVKAAILAHLGWLAILLHHHFFSLAEYRQGVWSSRLGWAFLAGVAFSALLEALRRQGEAPRIRWKLILSLGLLLNVGVEGRLLAPHLPGARYRSFRMVSTCMAPTLEAEEQVVADLGWYQDHAPRRQDLVLFEAPISPGDTWVMRCVALPGDRVEFKDGAFFLNGARALEDLPLPPRPMRGEPLPRYGEPFRVPEGTLFCLGDNREASFDSRFWGPLPLGALKGRPLYVSRAKDPSRLGKPLT